MAQTIKEQIQEKLDETKELLECFKSSNPPSTGLMTDLVCFYEGQIVAYKDMLDIV